jgi:hypothetical protein
LLVQADRIDTAVATAALPDDLRAALKRCATPQTVEQLAQFVDAESGHTDPQRGYRVTSLLLSLGAIHWM